jgi:hypothetical protein
MWILALPLLFAPCGIGLLAALYLGLKMEQMD